MADLEVGNAAMFFLFIFFGVRFGCDFKGDTAFSFSNIIYAFNLRFLAVTFTQLYWLLAFFFFSFLFLGLHFYSFPQSFCLKTLIAQ